MRLSRSPYSFLLIAGLLIVLASSCAKKSEHGYYATADSGGAPAASPQMAPIPDDGSGTPNVLSSSAARVSSDTSRKFIRTADLKFKVKNATQATYKLEEITARHHGYVGETKLESEIENRTTVPISEDSSLTTINYAMTNAMTLRVPDSELDTTLKEIAPLIDFLDHRTIRAEDISLKLLRDKVAAEREAKSSARLSTSIDKHGKKLGEVTEAEDALLARQESADEAQLDAMELMDSVRFSTIQIQLYERASFRHEVVPNEKNIEEYQPGLGTRLVEALRFGWSLLEDIIVGIARIWGVLLFFGVGIYLLVKLLKRREKTLKVTQSGTIKAEVPKT